jgi:hypothetical protein
MNPAITTTSNMKEGPSVAGSVPKDRESLLSTRLPDSTLPQPQSQRELMTSDEEEAPEFGTAHEIRDLYDVEESEIVRDQTKDALYNTAIRHGFAAEYQSEQYMNFLAEVNLLTLWNCVCVLI